MALIGVASPSSDIVKTLPVSCVGKGDLRKLFSEPRIVNKVCGVLGIPQREVGQTFCCVIPEHEREGHAEAMLCRNRKGVIVYCCSHLRGTSASLIYLTLPEAYFARMTGAVRKLRGPTGAVWALDLLKSAGILQPVDDVGLPELPATASATVSKVHTGFRRLLAVKWTYETGAQSVTFSHRFAAEWCGVSEREASQAIKELLSLKIIHIAAHIPGPFGKPMALFAPGPGSESQNGGCNG